MSEIQSKIKELLTQINDLKKVRKHLKQLEADLGRDYKALSKLEKDLDKNLKDVEELEKLSMRSVFLKVLGSKEEQLEKERQEYLQMSLKLNELKSRIEMLEFEKEVLEKKSGDEDNLRKRLEQLKFKRENEIIHEDSSLRRKLLKIAKESDELYVFKKEMAEALQAGEKALSTLKSMLQLLKKAKQWGNWDMWSSKGGIGTYYKHDAIDRAKNLSFQARHQLYLFEQELKDIGGEFKIHFNVNLDQFSRFTDVFFDNLISDWIIQQKIVNALNNVQSVNDNVRRILQSVQVDMKRIDDRLQQNQKEKDQILLS